MLMDVTDDWIRLFLIFPIFSSFAFILNVILTKHYSSNSEKRQNVIVGASFFASIVPAHFGRVF